jgi:nitrogen-specific signal transduction histidine kinase
MVAGAAGAFSVTMKALSSLAGGIAHEFDNALSSIAGHIWLIEQNYAEDQRLAGYVGRMEIAPARLIRQRNW